VPRRIPPIDPAIPYPQPPLTGTTFTLRPFRADDFDAAFGLGQDPATALWVPPLPAADGPGVVEYFEECREEGGLLHLVIADRVSDAYLGEVVAVLDEHRVAELGCGVVPVARGRGVATEALRLLAGWALGTLGLGRLQLFVATQNVAALRLAQSAGFCREGVLRAYWDADGERIDAVVFSRLPTDGS
jgi:RimJ/RimL family protein N-acetyltransferase